MAWFYAQPFFFMPGVTLTLFIVGLLARPARRVRGGRCPPAAARRHDGVRPRVVARRQLVAPMPAVRSLLRDQWLTFTYVGGALLLLAHRPDLVHALRAGWQRRPDGADELSVADCRRWICCSPAMPSASARSVRCSGFVAALACFGAEAAFSTIWLKHFRFGPAEWLWRSLTYGRWQPMRRGAPALR